MYVDYNTMPGVLQQYMSSIPSYFVREWKKNYVQIHTKIYYVCIQVTILLLRIKIPWYRAVN